MVAQFTEGLPCIKVNDKGIFFDASAKDRELEEFYERVTRRDIEHFKISPRYAQGVYAFAKRLKGSDLRNVQEIKCHITGPFTIAASLKDENQVALLHDHTFMQVILEGLLMKALWQIKLFEGFGKSIIVFIDEPYLGCFGSAFTPINREEVIETLSLLTEKIETAGLVRSGVHCCGNTDWSMLTDITTLDIINFDAFGFLERFTLYADSLEKFLKNGGAVCWGIVPTQDFTDELTAASLLERIRLAIERLVQKGVEKELLLENLLISPSCGLGTLQEHQAEKILKLLAETSQLYRKNLF
jgi:methionine synthase II (cobalamin-independent)